MVDGGKQPDLPAFVICNEELKMKGAHGIIIG
jgi:hypothetical protein